MGEKRQALYLMIPPHPLVASKLRVEELTGRKRQGLYLMIHPHPLVASKLRVEELTGRKEAGLTTSICTPEIKLEDATFCILDAQKLIVN